jgi:hypothetical protein
MTKGLSQKDYDNILDLLDDDELMNFSTRANDKIESSFFLKINNNYQDLFEYK